MDDDTLERLLAGDLDPADAPPGSAEVAAVLAAATAEPSPDELAGEAAAGAELAAVTRARQAADAARSAGRRRRIGLAVAVVVGALSTGGVAAAATGHLPEPIRQAAEDVLTRVGVATADPPAGPGQPAAEGGAGADRAADGGEARPTGTTGHGRHRPDAAAPAGADARSGLCRAYLAGKGSRQGRNAKAAAFRALAAAAGGPDRIASWCQGTRPGGGTNRGGDPGAPPGKAGDHGQGTGQGGPPPGKGSGAQRGNGGQAGRHP